MDIVSLVASIVSVSIAIFAVWLSVTFYRMSENSAKDIKESSKAIGSSVERLEKIFDKLYTDTFSMMRETVSDMRKHIWPDAASSERTEELVEKKADHKVEQLRNEIKVELSNVMANLGKTDAKVSSVRRDFEVMIDRVIKQSRSVDKEAREETLVETLKSMLRDFHPGDRVHVDQVVKWFAGKFPPSQIVKTLWELSREGAIEFDQPFESWRMIDAMTKFIIVRPQ